jgi:pimeloyl-ACP methyl ester carboxylesterase
MNGDILARRGVLILLSISLPAAVDAKEDREKARKQPAVQALFGLQRESDGPFPSDRFTVVDETQNTCKRTNLTPQVCDARPDQPSSCIEIEQLNALDGFNIKPRISIPFSDSIDLSTVDSTTIFLVGLGNSLIDGTPDCSIRPLEDDEDDDVRPRPGAGWIVGINQAVWDPISNTLYVEADEILDQHTHYAVIVTRGVKGSNGVPIAPAKAFKNAIGDDDEDVRAVIDPAIAAYQKALRAAIREVRFFGVRRREIAAASVFTTMSVSAVIEKIRDQVLAAPAPAPADFALGPNGERALFSLSSITALNFNRQQQKTGPLSTASLAGRLATLRAIPGVSQLAWGRYKSPNYLGTDRIIPTVATFSGVPVVQSVDTVYFNVVIPSATSEVPRPAKGWPVIVYGQGTGDNLNGAPFNVAANFASHGFATVAINLPGQGLGPASTITVARTGAPALTFPEGGRAVDVNNDGTFLSPEGWDAPPPKSIQLGRNASRQGAVDVMQLIRVLEIGVDVDGDGTVDLNPTRVYYAGISSGSAVGAVLAAIDPRVRATVMSGIGGWPTPFLEPLGRGPVGAAFERHAPSLLNPSGTVVLTSIGGVNVAAPFFNENIPDRGQAPLVNRIDGALPIQEWMERLEWLSETGAAGAYSVYWRLKPLAGVKSRPVLIQMSRGDQQGLNPITAQLVRAALIDDRVSLYRHDLFTRKTEFKDPHSLVIRTDNAVMKDLAVMAQEQISAFFASDGAEMLDPDGPGGVLFEVPAAAIPQDFGFTL